jgi:hypothetical protein
MGKGGVFVMLGFWHFLLFPKRWFFVLPKKLLEGFNRCDFSKKY